MAFPILLTNAWQVFRARNFLSCLKNYWLFGAMLMISMWLTTFVTANIPETALYAIIGTVIVIFAITSLLFTPPQFSNRHDRVLQIIFGATAGIFGGLTAIWAPPLVIYLVGRRVDKDEFVRATGLLILLGSIPLCLGFWRAGLLTGSLAITSAAMIIPALAGFSLGEAIRRRLPTESFRTVVLLIFLVMGLNLVRRSLF